MGIDNKYRSQIFINKTIIWYNYANYWKWKQICILISGGAGEAAHAEVKSADVQRSLTSVPEESDTLFWPL